MLGVLRGPDCYRFGCCRFGCCRFGCCRFGCCCFDAALHLHFTCISLVHRQLFEAMDRDPPHDDGISKDEFIFYYSAYEDYLRDAFAGYCVQDGVNDLNFDIHAAEWYYQNSEGRWQSCWCTCYGSSYGS